MVIRVFTGAIFVLGLTAHTALAQQPCEKLATLKVGTATITSAKTVAEGPFTMPAFPGAPAPANPSLVPARCDVAGVIRPTPDSEIKFALWLPASGWNGKYRQNGNGGWAGNIPYASMIDPLRRGYAVAATDDGHEGGGANWAVGHPEKLIDFGYRAVHEVAVHAKAIAQAHYGTLPSRSYFMGCSDGGREALMEAQRYPEDFHGIIAAAPANRWSHLFTSFVWNELALLKSPESRIPAAKLPAIQAAVHAACDSHDGVKDSLLEDPRTCRFDPAVLACKGVDSEKCLTPPQLEALKAIYGGPRNPRTNEQIYPGIPPGTEALTWGNWIVGDDPTKTIQSTLGNPYYGQAVHEQVNWDVRTMDFDKDFRYGEQKAAPILNSSSPDLRSFRANGGKLIQYHGWGDSAISALSSIEYYEAVRAFMTKAPDGRGAAAGKPIEDFYRLFMVPGMGHCQGGPGPNRFGNSGPVRPDTINDPERDVFAALEQWVEKGRAPEQLIGEGTVVGDPTKKLTRPLCQYPKVARHKGSGDINDAASFSCALAAAR